MKFKWLAFAIITILAVTTIFVIPRINRIIPDVPVDDIHVSVINISECINCHLNANIRPLPSGHAARDKCLYCHKMKKSSSDAR
ncbi:MAG: hypothetical protein IT393_11700 [Nitrospirae bacterium]|nr:hypothetical protein [Nitrospirota bacterium]